MVQQMFFFFYIEARKGSYSWSSYLNPISIPNNPLKNMIETVSAITGTDDS